MPLLRFFLFLAWLLLGLLSQAPRLFGQYTWQLLSASPQNGQKQDDVFFLNPELGWSVNGSGRIFRTTDGGASWQQQVQRPGTYFRCIGFVDSLRGFAGNIGPNYFPGVTDATPLYRTTDGGASWTPVPATQISGPQPTGLCAIQVIDSQHLVAGGRVGGPALLLRSNDGGLTWQSSNLGAHIRMVTDLYFSSPDTGWVFGGSDANVQLSRAKIIHTTDGGATWTTVFTGSRTFELCWKAAFPSPTTGYATLLNYAPNYPERFVAKTTDGGDTWTELPLANNSLKAFGIGFVDESTGWVGTDAGGYETTDGGLSWTPRNLGNFVNKIRILPGPVGYAIGQRIFKMNATISATTDPQAATTLVDLQGTVFPNPASRELTIRYQLHQPQAVDISLYDSQGRLLDTILSARQPGGEQQVQYSFPAHLMPGLVQVVIRTANQIQVLPVSVLP